MTITTTNLVMGPGTLYVGTYGATEPADTAVNASPAASAWTDVGATSGGLSITISQTFKEMEVDQLVDTPERRVTKRETLFKTSMAEATLENLAYALNGGTANTGSGYKSYDPSEVNSASATTYKALIFDGWGPSNKRRRWIGRKMLSVESIESSYTKDGQTLFPVTFASHWISASTRPWRVIDDTSA